MINELNDRAQSILRLIVDSYMETGEPVGSRTISRFDGMDLSPATIRNVMADLEAGGLLFAPHTSAGRLPTQRGLRLYVDGLMEVGDLSDQDRRSIETQCSTAGESMNQVLERATSVLAGLSAAAGLVVAPKTDKPVRQIQFLQLEPGKVLVVLVMQDNMVENRVMEVPPGLPAAALVAASNYLNDRLAGKTLFEARHEINSEIAQNRTQLDRITTDLVQRGLALAPQAGADGHIIIRGQSKLLQDVRALEDLEKARQLLAVLEEQETAGRLLEAAHGGEGIQIFIGTENRVFEHSGWSMVISPYRTPENRIIGAIGVIGPSRLNYGRIIPVVDYTARVMSRLIGGAVS
jgi:heat-inducible transcriptional repressor